MLNTIKKALLASVGAALITKEKAEETLQDFVAQGRVSAQDAKAMARRLAEDGRREFKSVSSEIEGRVRSFTERTDSQAKARIAALEARIAELERKKANPAKRSRRTRAKARGA